MHSKNHLLKPQGEDWPEYSFNVEDNFKRNDFKKTQLSLSEI